MKKKNIFNTLIFWKSLIVLISVVFIGGCSCMLIFYFKIFEKWDKAKVIEVGRLVAVGNDMYGADIKYIANGKEYQKFMTPGSGIGYQWFPDNNEEFDNLYVDFLVSDPTYTFTDRLSGLIPFSIAEAVLIMGGTIYIVKRIRKPKEKQNERK